MTWAGVWAYRPEGPLRGVPGGPLSGLTFSAKDLYGVPGWPLRAGSRAALPRVAESELVRRGLAAGADLLGSTQLHEIALGITGSNAYGGTPNPLDPARVAGGSSGGAAASVATGQVDFALGTDTGGSVRVPASWCGVWGFKPTYGLYPLAGALPLSATCDHAGTLARGVGTLARIHRAVTGQAVGTAGWSGQRVGLWNVPAWCAPGTWAELERFARDLEARGASLGRFDFPDVLDSYTPIVLSEAAAVHRAELSRPAPGFGAGTLALLRRGQALTQGELTAARKRREALRAALVALFDQFDLLLAPAVPDVAPLIGQDELDLPGGSVPLRQVQLRQVPLRQAVLRLTAPWSLLGAPTLAAPLPLRALSLGAQLIAPWGADADLLALGLALNEPEENP